MKQSENEKPEKFFSPSQILYTDHKFLRIWPRQILLKITILTVSLKNVLCTSQRRAKKFYRMIRLEDVLWKRLGKTSWRNLEDVLKMPWRRLQEGRLRPIYSSWPWHLEDENEVRLQDVLIKTNIIWDGII